MSGVRQLNEILNAVSNQDAFNEGKKHPRSYNKESNYIYKPEKARFKLCVWFKDGKTRYFYSYDSTYISKNNKKIRIVDEYESLMRLYRLVHKYQGKFKNAYIYMTENYNVPRPDYKHLIFKENIRGEKVLGDYEYINQNLNVFLKCSKFKDGNINNPL